MQPYPRAPDLVWPGHLHGTGCLSARAMDTGFPTVVWRLCLRLGGAWVWVSVTPPALPGVSGGFVWVRLVVSPLFPPLGIAVFAVWLGFRPAANLSGLGFWDVLGCVRAPPAHRRFLFWCVVWACVPGSGFRLRPAPPWRGVGVCVCLCARPAWSLAPPGCGCAAGVCGWAWAAAAPHHSRLGCWGVCVFFCAPCLYPAFPGWGVLCGRVCWARVLAAPRPSWLGCRGVRAVVRVPRLHPPFLGGRLWRGGVRVLPLDGFAPLPPLWFFISGGFVVSVPGCPCLGSRGLCPPIPCLPGRVVCCLFFFRPSVVCVCVFWRFPLPVGRCPRFGVAGFGWVVPQRPFGGSCLRCCLSGGFGRLLWCWWAAWWSLAVLAPPPCFFFWQGSACFYLCLPWAGARTGWHSVWLSGLLLVVAFCQAVPRHHGSGGLCTRWAQRPFLSVYVLALQGGRLRQEASCGPGLAVFLSSPRCRF